MTATRLDAADHPVPPTIDALPTLDARIRSTMLSDALDDVGRRHQAMSGAIRPLRAGMVAYGRAATLSFVPAEDYGDAPYDDAIEFLDALRLGSFAVVATGPSERSAFWGELFSAAATGRGCRGVVCDGPIRDTDQIAALGFPAFAPSTRPVDYKGRMRVAAVDVDVVCAGVAVRPGDLVFADADGVVVVPRDLEETVIEAANTRASSEKRVLGDLVEGATVRQVWQRYGVL